MTYLLDTDILIDASRGRMASKELIENLVHDGIAISGMTYGELWEGAIDGPGTGHVARLIEALLLPFTIHWPDRDIMQQYGAIRVHLRKQVNLISAPDIVIAATAIRHSLTLVTRNLRHFGRIPELRLVAPADLA